MAMEYFHRLVPYLKCIKLAFRVLHGHFGPVYLLQVSKKDDEKCCFLKQFGLSISIFDSYDIRTLASKCKMTLNIEVFNFIS